MPVIVTSRGRTRQPPNPAEVALGNPLTRGTATGLLPIPGGVYETARGAVRRPYVVGTGGSLGIRPGVLGLGAAQVATTSDYWDLDPDAASDPTTGPYCSPSLDFTMLVLCERYGNAGGNAPIFAHLSPSISPYYSWGLADTSGSGTLEFNYNSAGTLYTVSGGTFGVGTHLIVAKRSVSAGTHAVWVNGAQRISAAGGTGAISYFASGGSRGTALGNFWRFSGNRSFNGSVALAWLWTRALSDQEIVEVSRNPWQLFAPVRRPLFFVSGGGVYDVALSEVASASESLGAAGALTSALAEAASAADVVSAAAAFAAAMSEAATASDSSTVATVRAGALSEAASAGDALTAAATLAGSIVEAVTASDTIASAATLLAALSEAAAAADTIDGSVGAATYLATLAEAASAGDAWSAASVIAGAVVEAVTAGDTVAAIATLAAAITEAATAADQVSSAATMAAAISEAVTAADAWSGSVGAAVLMASITEAVTAGDVFAALELLARFGVRGARGVSVQANARRAQLQRSVRRN